MHHKRILVIIPAYNEENNIAGVIKEIKSLYEDYDIVVVDDCSSDHTRFSVVENNVPVLSLSANMGIGGAVQTGFQYAIINGYDYAVRVDGDGQHDVKYIGALLDEVVVKGADIACGSRFIAPFVGYRSSFLRRVGINFFSCLLSFLTGQKITDPTSGFQCFSRKALEIFADNYPVDFPEPESIVMAKRFGLKFVEIPVEMRKRAAGSSSIRYLRTFYYMLKVTVAILLDIIKHPGGRNDG